MWTEKMENELRRIHRIHRGERDLVGGESKFSRGRLFSRAKAVDQLKRKFPDLLANEGFHATSLGNKVVYLGLSKL